MTEKIIIPFIDIEELENKVISYKSYMLEWCQKHKHIFKLKEYQDNGKQINGQQYFGMTYHLNGEIIAKARAHQRKKLKKKSAVELIMLYKTKLSIEF